ncbi:MAG TPA: cupredoxin domain-containing protein [Gemmatimonadaceae bacterium]|jgi:plastocyanin|nr:cupredoxin domain-containing protein [Gemmatimonadaceae bacterium]
MRVRLVLPVLAIAFAAACGSDSTGPTPPAHTAAISITNSGFDPASKTVQTNTLVTWTVTSGDDHHVIRFTGTVPSGGNPNSSVLTTGQSASTTFLQTGTYNYVDTLHTEHTGVVVVTN